MTRIPAELRRFVIERASHCCEYCRINVEDRSFPYEIDHIIAEKHGGATDEGNLCLACYRCNGFKGSDIASVDPETERVTFLYHPRHQHWEDHFRLNGSFIEPLTAEGRVTVFLLRLNAETLVEYRSSLMEEGRYPCL